MFTFTFDRGALKYHIKAYTLAIRDLTQAIAIDSSCTLAYFNRAVCYQDSGNWHKVRIFSGACVYDSSSLLVSLLFWHREFSVMIFMKLLSPCLSFLIFMM